MPRRVARSRERMRVKVCKFGGSSLCDAAQAAKVLDIVAADPDRRIVVVSAPGKRDPAGAKVTDLLIDCAEGALAGRDPDGVLGKVLERYGAILSGLGLPDSFLGEIERDLRNRVAGDRADRGAFLDLLKAAGEDNMAKLLARAFQARGVQAAYWNPRDAGLILTGEAGNAQVLEESYPRLSDALSRQEGIVVFPGFFGFTREGRVTTFPRGGSDITGAILAAALRADEYENFTDVDAVYPADPRLVPEVREGIAEMTYREMRELSYAGFGIFHDEAVIPAVRAGIPIRVRNTNRPREPGTRIVRERRAMPGSVVGIASADGFCTIYVDKYMMNRELGFGRRLLQIFETEGVSYEHMPSGIDNVSVVLRDEGFDAERERRVVRRIRSELKPDAVMIERGYALVMVVGEGLYYTVGMAARATRALAAGGLNIEMMNQGSSEISMMFGVKSEQREKAVRALYAAFFP